MIGTTTGKSGGTAPKKVATKVVAKKAATKKVVAKKAAPKKAATKKVAVKKAAPRKTAPATEFQVHVAGAKDIFLAGDFNDWSSGSKDFRLRKFKGDIFKKKLKLKPGRYEYKFVVDGNWWTDPENSERARNPYYSENSVITVK